jgi:hypothetical protein
VNNTPGDLKMNDLDMTPRYAPTKILFFRKGKAIFAPVIQAISHPPGNHPADCPIKTTMTALELRTEYGSRWFGCERAYINSELRMVVEGTNKLDEIRMKWPICHI